VITRLQDSMPKVTELLEDAEEDLLAFYTFPQAHWTKLRFRNPIVRFYREM
jgi:putative transposase